MRHARVAALPDDGDLEAVRGGKGGAGLQGGARTRERCGEGGRQAGRVDAVLVRLPAQYAHNRMHGA